MPEIILDGSGKTKAALVEMAYEQLGLSGAEYEREAEEITIGLRELNGLMADMLADGIDLGYDFPTYAEGLAEEPSGIPNSAVMAVTSLLAQRISGGKFAMSPDAKAALSRSYTRLQSRHATVPKMKSRESFMGAGYKGRLSYYRTS